MVKILGEGKGKEILKSLSEKLDEIVKKEIGNVNTNVILVSKDQIKEMNREFRGENFPTDVLTFPLLEEVYGEIYICPEVVEENAKEYNNTFEKELIEVVIHGILHLAGYDHEFEDKNAKEMFEKQHIYVEEVWNEWRSSLSGGIGQERT
ncbi:rRNA maturation RNase YbeY [Thermotoga sp. SG1]|uniref:rRNA maturation RNase YbeY n=1 Tax=Thermotoga sp. SG1 TaxID=126739 RepID=UPI000C778AF1|nr:rRNA maturation RNase YbeY [Thermotoga sp. SG1]PLV55626.1 rRNA maturation RNase YbeY [Thermotoga sp. SG1]